MSDQTTSIRRQRSRRLDVTVLVAAALVVIVALALLFVRPAVWSAPRAAPAARSLTSSVRVCPPGLVGGDHVAAYSDAAGTLAYGGREVRLEAGVPATLTSTPRTQILTARGAAAASLAAGRWSLSPLSATDCAGPVADQWFVGLGAGPVHDSVVQVTNPNPGDAVVDLDVYDANGPAVVPSLRGVAVPAHTTKTFDLLKTMPRNGALAVHAVVERGQAVVTVVDRALHLSGTRGNDEWLAPQRHPQQRDVILGVGSGQTDLTAFNPTQNQITLTLKVVTPDAVLSPAAAPTVDVPPQSVVVTSLAAMLRSSAAQGALGIEVQSTGRVVTSVRRATAHDLVTATTGDRVGQSVRVLVPPGTKHLLLLGDTGVGTVTVTSYTATGRGLGHHRVAVQADQGASVRLPADAAVVSVDPDKVSVVGSVLVSNAGGAAVIPLREHPSRNLVPAVRPGLR